MYALSVRREFRAEHFLIGGDWGAENQPHPHAYRLEVELEGESLDAHGYLLDIVELEARLEAIVSRYSGQRLNDQPEFAGLNPEPRTLRPHCLRRSARGESGAKRAADSRPALGERNRLGVL